MQIGKKDELARDREKMSSRYYVRDTVVVIDGLDIQLKGSHDGTLAQKLSRMEDLGAIIKTIFATLLRSRRGEGEKCTSY